MSFARVYAIIVRQFFQLKRDLSRIAEIIWYPVIDLTIWGLVTSFLADQAGPEKNIFIYFMGGMMLWVFVYRMQMNMSLSLMVDMWERNFLNIYTSPITNTEYILGLTIASVLKILITFVILFFIALNLYFFNIFTLGIYLAPFALSLLIMGWWMGTIINGFVLCFGYKIESFAWGLVYVFNPLSGVFFPLSAMPPVMRLISLFLPSSYIFEGMRQVFSTGILNTDLLIMSFGLNIIYCILAVIVFSYLFKSSLRSGMLVKLSD